MEYVYKSEREKRDPPPKRAAALAFVRSEIASNRGFPTLRMIADHMGWKNESSARSCLDGLIADGTHQLHPQDEWRSVGAGAMTSAWDDENNVKLLKKLWADGWSAAQIATRIPVSRSGVIGKVHRLGLSGRVTLHRCASAKRRRRAKPKPSLKSSWGSQYQRRAIYERAPKFSSEPLPPPRVEDIARKTLLELEDRDCRFPVGDASPQMFCAARKIDGMPYCLTHALRAFQPATPRTRGPTKTTTKPGGTLIRIAGPMKFEEEPA